MRKQLALLALALAGAAYVWVSAVHRVGEAKARKAAGRGRRGRR